MAPQSIQATRGLQFGARCGGLADTAIRVEGAALNARGRPDVRARPREPAAPVGHDQGWGRDPAHERAPGPGILTPSRVPAQHTIGCLGDEHHDAWAQVDAVNEDDLMNLIDDRAQRPQLPQRLTTPTKRTTPTRQIHLTATTKEPGQELKSQRVQPPPFGFVATKNSPKTNTTWPISRSHTRGMMQYSQERGKHDQLK